MNMLERLYNDFQNYEEIKDSLEVSRRLNEFDEKINELLPSHKSIELETQASDVFAAFEKQGFMNGIKYAMQLQHECLK